MKHPRQVSLQSRLMILVLGFAAAVWLGSALITWRDAQGEIDELLDGHLAQFRGPPQRDLVFPV